MIYIHSYVPFTHGEKNGCAMILYNTYSSSFVATISEPEGDTTTLFGEGVTECVWN